MMLKQNKIKPESWMLGGCKNKEMVREGAWQDGPEPESVSLNKGWRVHAAETEAELEFVRGLKVIFVWSLWPTNTSLGDPTQFNKDYFLGNC